MREHRVLRRGGLRRGKVWYDRVRHGMGCQQQVAFSRESAS